MIVAPWHLGTLTREDDIERGGKLNSISHQPDLGKISGRWLDCVVSHGSKVVKIITIINHQSSIIIFTLKFLKKNHVLDFLLKNNKEGI